VLAHLKERLHAILLQIGVTVQSTAALRRVNRGICQQPAVVKTLKVDDEVTAVGVLVRPVREGL
jgi:hypothetical protein